MIVIALIKNSKLPALRKAFEQTNWQLWQLANFSLKGELVSRVIIQCDKTPQPEWKLFIEATVQEPNYCFCCGKKLQSHNRSGYCSGHQDKNPARSPSRKKKKT